MPRVPTYESNLQPQAMPGLRVNTEAPIEAFGGGRTLNQVQEAGQNVLNTVDKIVLNEKQKADDVAHVNSRNEILKLRTQIQYDPNQGFLSKKGSNVRGLPEQVQGNWNDGIEKVRGSLVNSEQRAAFDKMATEEGGDLNRDLQRHLYVEGVQFDKDTTEANLELEINNGANHYNSPEQIEMSKKNLDAAITGFGGRNGQSAETTGAHRQRVFDRLHGKIIDRYLLEEGGVAAKKYFDENSGEISGDQKILIGSKIEKAVNQELGEQVWNTFSAKPENRLVGGYPNMAKIENDIMGQDLPYKDKRQQVEVAKALAAEQTSNIRKTKEASDHNFMNGLIGGKQQGWDLSTAMKFARSTTNDNYDQQLRVQAAKDMWDTGNQSDIQVKYALWEEIQDGNGDSLKIDQAMEKGLVNGNDWISLKKDLYQEANGATPADEKNVNNKIRALADQKFHHNKESRANFLNTVNSIAKQKKLSPQEKWNLAQEELTPTKVTKEWGPFWWTSEKKQFEFDMSTLDKQNETWGKLHTVVGQKEIVKIGESIRRSTGKDTVSLNDIQAFSAEFGGWQNIAKGTKVNNAIKSLIRGKRAVNPQNIKRLLELAPDGNY